MIKIQKKKRIVIAMLLLIFTVLLCARLYRDNFTFETTTYGFIVDSSNEEYSILRNKTIVQISDLHNIKFKNNNLELIEAVNTINPNYILFTGDMVSAEDIDFSGFYSLVDAFSKKYTCFYVVGNHELGLSKSDLRSIYEYLNEKGVYVLDNNFVKIDGINFYGLNYKDKYYVREDYTLDEMINDLRSS